jgi:membrane-associated phospholipid phosphatase
MRASTVALILFARAAWADGGAPPLERPSPFQVDLRVDLPVAIAGTALWVVPFGVASAETKPPPCDPCDPANINVMDRYFIRFHTHSARAAAYGLEGGVGATLLILSIADYGPRDYRAWLGDLLIGWELLAIQGALDEAVRRAVRRPRPFLYEPGVYPTERTSGESALAFYSGHTSAIVALSIFTAWGFQLRHPRSPWRWVLWTTLLGASAAEAVLRVAAGDHFPSDVLVGVIVGTGLGIAVPALHLRPRAGPLSSLTLLPTPVDGGGVLSLGGRF